MSFRKITLPVIASFVLMVSVSAFAQSSSYVKQVLTANSGKFEYVPPYTDYVSLQSYNPQTQAVNIFGAIYTQSAQSIVLSGGVGFVAAQDSIVKYNLNTFQRMSAVADSGLNQMALYNGKLIITKQYPVNHYYVEVLDTSNLGLIARIPGLSGDCGSACALDDTVYVAVNGGWMGTEGKLAVIDPGTWTLKREINFGHLAIGIWNLYTYKGGIISVNKTPYGVSDTGSVTVYKPLNSVFVNVFLPHRIAGGSGIKDSLLFLGIDYGIGSFNLNTLKILSPSVIADPGSSVFTYILSSTVDTLESRIYVNVGDYVTPGYCLVSSLAGDSITSFPTGISSDAVAVDTRNYPVSVNDKLPNNASATIFPNPVQETLKVRLAGAGSPVSFTVSDVSGRVLMDFKPRFTYGVDYEIPVNTLAPGLYYLIIGTPEGRITKPFAVTAR